MKRPDSIFEMQPYGMNHSRFDSSNVSSAQESVCFHISKSASAIGIKGTHSGLRTKSRKAFSAKFQNYSFGDATALASQVRYGYSHGSQSGFNVTTFRVKVLADGFLAEYTTQAEAAKAAVEWLRRAQNDLPQRESEQIVAFKGKVTSIAEGQAEVFLIDEATGNRFRAVCEAQHLQDNQIGVNDDFSCRVIHEPPGTKVVFEKLEKRELTENEVTALESKYRALFP